MKLMQRGCIAFVFNRYKAFRSNIVNRGNEAENFNKYVEATVKALFHSAVAAFYVDVQHDWFHTVRKADKMPPSLPTDGS